MSASYLALGHGERFAGIKQSDLILTTAQLEAFRQSLAFKVSQLADEDSADIMRIQFLRGEIAAFTVIINASVEALQAAESGNNSGE